MLPGYIIRYKEHTTESSFRLRFKRWFLLFLFCFIQFHEQASYIYKSVSGKHCQWLRLSEWNGTSLRWCSLHKWIGKNWICTEQMVCMCWMRGHLKIILPKKSHWAVSKWTLFFWLGVANFSHTFRVLGVWDILFTLTCLWANVHLESSCLLTICCQVLEYNTHLRGYFLDHTRPGKTEDSVTPLCGVCWKKTTPKPKHFSVHGAAFLMTAGTAHPKGEPQWSLPSS